MTENQESKQEQEEFWESEEKKAVWAVKHTGVILRKGGHVHHAPVKGDKVTNPSGGSHLVEAYARHWNPKPIPRGWLTVWVDDDPEPVTHRQPTGYTRIDVERLTGNMKMHQIHGPLKPTGEGMNLRWLIIGLGVLAALSFAVWVFARRFG